MKRLVMMLLSSLVFLFRDRSYYKFKLDHKDGHDILNIDCGLSTDRYQFVDYHGPGVYRWKTDEGFIKSGINMEIPTTTYKGRSAPPIVPMTTLRFFPKGKKNCYSLRLKVEEKYLLRAGFFYGNYDNLSKPPTFDLQINGQDWATINTTLGEDPVYVELVYQTKVKNVQVCLVRTGDTVPFISSLEARFWPCRCFYRLMGKNTALKLHIRSNFHGETDVGELDEFAFERDDINRIWKLRAMSDYQTVRTSASYNPYGSSLLIAENWTPIPILEYAIAPRNPNDPITMLVDLPLQNIEPAYFVFYFKLPNNQQTETSQGRRIHIYIDGMEMKTVDVRQTDEGQVVSLYPVDVSGSHVNVTLATDEGSPEPPILNAMEVFTSMELSGGGCSWCYHFVIFTLLLLPAICIFSFSGIRML